MYNITQKFEVSKIVFQEMNTWELIFSRDRLNCSKNDNKDFYIVTKIY